MPFHRKDLAKATPDGRTLAAERAYIADLDDLEDAEGPMSEKRNAERSTISWPKPAIRSTGGAGRPSGPVCAASASTSL
jgi:hypothetical protein